MCPDVNFFLSKQKTAGPRKADLKRSGHRSEREYDDSNKFKNRYYVGGRELDRRSRVHRERSRSRERKHGGKSSSKKSRSRSRSRSRSHHSRRRSYSRDRDGRDRDSQRDSREHRSRR